MEKKDCNIVGNRKQTKENDDKKTEKNGCSQNLFLYISYNIAEKNTQLLLKSIIYYNFK